MKWEYYYICSNNVKYSSLLFGDDVPKTVKEIVDCSLISHKLCRKGMTNVSLAVIDLALLMDEDPL